MCVCNSNNANYEIIISTKADELICDINFKSIGTVCRFLESNVNFDICNVHLFRTKTNQQIDIELLMSIWKTNLMED